MTMILHKEFEVYVLHREVVPTEYPHQQKLQYHDLRSNRIPHYEKHRPHQQQRQKLRP